MSTPLFTVVEGWTGDLVASLRVQPVGGSLATFDATGMTVSSVMHDKHGKVVAIATAWDDATISRAKLSPLADGLLASLSPYTHRFKVVDGDGKVFFWPALASDGGAPSQIVVAAQ